jgi:glycosyltransferase involved in cell wall biosynthesis
MFVMIKTKICHLTSVHPRYDVRIFLKECKYLTSQYDVSLVVADGKGDEEIFSIHILDVGKPSSRLRRILFTANKVYRKAIDLDCEIYHFHDPELIFIGRKLLKKGKKVIYDVHEDVPRQLKSKKYHNIIIRYLSSYLIEKVENHYALKFSAIITATEFIKSRFEKLNNLTSEVRNFPILDEFDMHNTSSRTENRICYIGGISEQRGINELIKIFDSDKNDFYLELAGEIENEVIVKKIMNVTHDKIKYLGIVNHNRIVELICKSKIGLVILHPTPNHLNSLPIKMFEYMAGGIPVIASDFPLWKQIIEENNCGICVNPYSLDSIQNAVQFLIDNESDRVKMGENGRIAVINKYQWDIEFKKLCNIYKEIA